MHTKAFFINTFSISENLLCYGSNLSPFGIGCISSYEAGVRRLYPKEGNPILDCVERGAHTVVCEIFHLGWVGTIRHPVDGCDDSLYERSKHNPRQPSPYSISMVLWVGGGLSLSTQIYCRVTNNNREITKDKRINGKSLRETETNGKSPTTPPREIPIWKQKILSTKILKKIFISLLL